VNGHAFLGQKEGHLSMSDLILGSPHSSIPQPLQEIKEIATDFFVARGNNL